jgi:agmatinase
MEQYPALAFFGRTVFDAPAVARLEDLAADVAFLGVPYDQGNVPNFWRSGQSRGPRAIRESRMPLAVQPQDGVSSGWFDIESSRLYLHHVRFADCGDVPIAPGDAVSNFDRITAATRAIVASGAIPVVLGGDHSVAFPSGRGVAQAHGGIDVIHIDAHPDFRDEIFGSKYSHGSNLRRLAELPEVSRVSALGLRNCEAGIYQDMKRMDVGYATSLDLLQQGPDEVVRRVLDEGRPAYVSIDIDVLDSSVVPGTTGPEPGGLSYRQLRSLLAAVAKRVRVIGFDVVETSPLLIGDPTSRLAAWIILHFLAEIFFEASLPVE